MRTGKQMRINEKFFVIPFHCLQTPPVDGAEILTTQSFGPLLDCTFLAKSNSVKCSAM